MKLLEWLIEFSVELTIAALVTFYVAAWVLCPCSTLMW
jgi:hypothetical protein